MTPMREYLKFYVDGEWVDPVEPRTIDVENPATEQVCGRIAIGSSADVAPFSGYKHSGNGREWGEFGFQDYLETKGIVGYGSRRATD